MFQEDNHGSVAQWSSHMPQEQKARVRIPPGYMVKISMLLFMYYRLQMGCLCVENRNKGIGPTYSWQLICFTYAPTLSLRIFSLSRFQHFFKCGA
jgi:hypothetical protein